MIIDPWVWEDFGGPIPCEAPIGPTPSDSGCDQSERTHSQAIITWAQMEVAEVVPAGPGMPPAPSGLPGLGELTPPGSSPETVVACASGNGTAPVLGLRFSGANTLDTFDEYPANGAHPPDTMGAIGPRHFLQVINGFVGVYDKLTGRRMRDTTLHSFFSGIPDTGVPRADAVFDPRVLFDQHSGRWIVAAVKGRVPSNLVVLSISLTDDPTGAWFQASYRSATTLLDWADYPTLGVDSRAIYVATDDPDIANPEDELWAIEKAPLIAQPPYAGFVQHWVSRQTDPASPLLSVERALQPAHTYGSGEQFLIQTRLGHLDLEIYRVTWPLSGAGCPTLINMGTVDVEDYLEPSADAPALGGVVNTHIVGARLMMAVFRDGFLWTCHTVKVDVPTGRSGCRWYKIDPGDPESVPPASPVLAACGTVADPTLWYYYPSLMVNTDGDVAMGFSGSHANQYVAAYFTGRTAADGTSNVDMAKPKVLKEGEGIYDPDQFPTRWGDYSYTTLDPVDQITFWTIQQYAETDPDPPPEQQNTWGTWIGQLSFGTFDCNANGLNDACDINCGPPGGPCDLPGCGQSDDCDPNGEPDENGIPDECELGMRDCNSNQTPDACDIAGGTSQDCNTDINLDGATNPIDRSIVVAAWTSSSSNCAA